MGEAELLREGGYMTRDLLPFGSIAPSPNKTAAKRFQFAPFAALEIHATVGSSVRKIAQEFLAARVGMR
jgi:hypothetical protein